MIAGVRGILREKGRDHVVLDVGPVDLVIYVPAPLLASDVMPGDRLELYTYLHVREAELSLFGFESVEQKELFCMLISVNGVGPRSALSLLSTLSTEVLISAIAEGKAEVLTRAPGIGLKAAQRIVLHLQDKLEKIRLGVAPPLTEADEDVIAALTALGYSLVEAQRAVQFLPKEVTDVAERLRLALEYFGGRR
ncbi:MAG: Holliday junction branch migration protein RuvA [Candidatus Methanomethyliaceae archaeon]